MTMPRILFLTLLVASPAWAAPIQDAKRHEDTFDDNSAIDVPNSSNFSNLGGTFEADDTTATLISECITLPPPSGGAFTAWDFVDVTLGVAADVSNTLRVESCDGLTVFVNTPIAAGCNSFAVPGATPASVRLVVEATHSGVPGGPVAAAQVNDWAIYGRTPESTVFSVDTPASVNSGEQITFFIPIAGDGAAIRDPIVDFSIDDINGLGNGVDDGLAEDAEIDYGNGFGLKTARPLEFVSASLGPAGEVPTAPAVGATAGDIQWVLNNIDEGVTTFVQVTMTVPVGYIDTKTVAARAEITYGDVSCDGSLNNTRTDAATSAFVPVSSETGWISQEGTAFTNYAPGQLNGEDTFWIRWSGRTQNNPTDIERVTFTVDSIGSCLPVLRNALPRQAADLTILSAHVPGDDIGTGSANGPLVVQVDRWGTEDLVGLQLRYDMTNCINGDDVQMSANIVGALPAFVLNQNTDSHPVVFETCRNAELYIHRIQEGDAIGNDYQPFPEFSEYYIYNDGSVAEGQFFSQWTPFGSLGNRTHTVVVDHTYVVMTVPAGISFHGNRVPDKVDRMYKDCTGTAPLPTDVAFVHGAVAPDAAWKDVLVTWPGAPFSDTPDENDPDAVVPPGCRLLIVNDADDPAPRWDTQSVWQMCDGTYCAPVADNAAVTSGPFDTYTNHLGVTQLCDASLSRTVYKESASWPQANLDGASTAVQAGSATELFITPENKNEASAKPQSNWVMNFFDVRDFVNLSTVQGSVESNGSDVPAGGDISTIVFTPPDPVGCAAALDDQDPACFGVWSIPEATQPPNVWGQTRQLKCGHRWHQTDVPTQSRGDAPAWHTGRNGPALSSRGAHPRQLPLGRRQRGGCGPLARCKLRRHL